MKKVIDSIDEIFSENDREHILKKVKSFYENKLAEKDKLASEEAMLRINAYQELKKELAEKDKEIEELKQQQLFKEDFKKIANTSFSSKGHTSFTTWELKDNSKYELLPSKDVK